MRLGSARGDEVIMAANAYVGVLASVVKCGATPVFVEAEADTANLIPAAVPAAVTPRTRAVVPMHAYGFPCDMDAVNELATRHHLAVIEDAAHALGAQYKGRPTGWPRPRGLLELLGKDDHGLWPRRGRADE